MDLVVLKLFTVLEQLIPAGGIFSKRIQGSGARKGVVPRTLWTCTQSWRTVVGCAQAPGRSPLELSRLWSAGLGTRLAAVNVLAVCSLQAHGGPGLVFLNLQADKSDGVG